MKYLKMQQLNRLRLLTAIWDKITFLLFGVINFVSLSLGQEYLVKIVSNEEIVISEE